ncbi:hypothetical protein [Agromyces luteolus]|uniref:Uncharacterized protein n=1 Tax=Agromyces luteolus TaxID=88373 RepID=A0A7C9MFA4_9MICO|nr:hypothetical protein [Agromyces luteolus]MUN05738.1 hypothetical protein [Agromyces luteolus]
MHAASGGFFDVERPEPGPEPEVPPMPPWLQPPQDELPGRVVLDELLHHDDATVLLLGEVAAYSSGLRLTVRCVHRRTDESPREWERRMMERHAWFPGRFPEPDGMHVGVRLADGTRLLPIDHQRVAHVDRDLTPPTLQVLGGGGGGGHDWYDWNIELWLWTGEVGRAGFEVVFSWPEFGILELGHVVDAEVLDVVPPPRQLWP